MNTNITRNIAAAMLAIFCATIAFLAPSVSAKQPDLADNNSLLIAEAPEAGKAGTGPIKIGYVVPLSGAAQGAGQQIVNGMQLYLDQIHHQMAGRKVEVLVENDGTNPATAAEKARKLIEQDHVAMISGVYMTNALYAMAPVVDSLNTPFIVVSSGAAGVTQRDRKKWLVRTCYTSTQLGFVAGDYLAKKLHYKRVVTIGADYGFGWETIGSFQQNFEKLGGKVVQRLWAPLGLTDFRQMLKSIRPDADAVFMVTVGQQVELIHKQYHEVGVKLPVIGSSNTFDSWVFPHLGDEVVGGICDTLYTTTLDNAANKAFVKAFKAKYHQDTSYVSEFGYTAMMFIHKAVDAVHGNVENKEALLAALKKVELKDAPRGPVKMDSYGASIDNVYITRVDKVNGALQNTVIDTYPAVGQFYTFNPAEILKQPPYTRDYPPCKFCQ